MNLKIKKAGELIDEQIDIAKKLDGDKLLIKRFNELKNILKIKDENKFYDKLLDEKTVKAMLFHVSKRFGKDYKKLERYVFSKSKSLADIKLTAKLEED